MTTEAEFLADQARRAKARLRRNVELLGEDLLAPVDVRSLVRRRPFWSVGGATIGGVIAGVLLGRKRTRAASVSRPAVGASRWRRLAQRYGQVARTMLGSWLVARLRALAASSPAPSSPPPSPPAAAATNADAVREPGASAAARAADHV
jgi:hypothetical protein